MEENQSLEIRVGKIENRIEELIKITVNAQKQTESLFKSIEENMSILNTKVDNLASANTKGFSKVEGKLDNLHGEVIKIQQVTNYTDEYENLLRITR